MPPEGAQAVSRWVKLVVSCDEKMYYDSGFEGIGVDEDGFGAFDLQWSSDSTLLAYRSLNTLRIVQGSRVVDTLDLASGNSLISSFRWYNNTLLIVVKGINEPIDGWSDKSIHYAGYLAKATSVKIFRAQLNQPATELYTQTLHYPTFLFHGVGFANDEVSPFSPRVAFSDGSNVCVYDDEVGKIVAKIPVSGSVEGTWWKDADRLIVGTGLLSSSARFYSMDVRSGSSVEVTERLARYWNHYGSSDWFMPGMK